MAKSTKSSGRKSSTRRKKSERQDARPFAHKTGRWAKKCKGRLIYLGKIEDDPDGEAAWNHWLDIRDDARAGRDFRQFGETDAALTVKALVNEFLNAKRLQIEAGEFSQRSHRELRTACERMAGVFGKSRSVANLKPADFERLRTEITKHCGPTRTKNEITRIKSAFRWAYKQGLIDKLPRYGAAFDPPSAKTIRLAKAAKGERLFSREEILSLLKLANVQQKARILLALNCGYGASDISSLPKSAIDLETGWIDFPRTKTGISRRCWLWPETRHALADAIAQRAPARDPAHDDRALLTRYGQPLVRQYKGAPRDEVARRFRKLLDKAGLADTGLSFYRLRHTHRTVADECGDQPACAVVMGHADNTMAGNYRQRVSDDRLRAVVDYVRSWLYEPDTDDDQADTDEPPATVKFPATA
jgi:integrase